jgi:hypothetical protein
MMGAVSLVTFIAGAAGVGAFVVAGAFVWEKSLGAVFQRKKREAKKSKGGNFILRNPTSVLLQQFAVPGNYLMSWILRSPDW